MTASAPTAPTVTRSVEVAASPEAVYALITDLVTLAELADEAVAMSWKKGSSAAVGNVFTGRNRNGARRWSTSCTVTTAEPGAAFAFDVVTPLAPIPISRWRYDIVATETGSRVSESTWDLRPGWFRGPGQLITGVRDRAEENGRHMEATLQRLRERAEAH